MKHKLGLHKTHTFLRSDIYTRGLLPFVVLVMTAVLGLMYLYISHAAVAPLSLQPESGTVTAPAAAITDTTASGAKAVQFNRPPTTQPPGSGTSPSWNPHVSCKAVVTTLTKVLGTQKSALGGATQAGGAFKPGVPDRRSTAQPCSVNGVPTFVEMHGLMTGACLHIGKDGDWSCELRDPSTSPKNWDHMKAMHIEIDGNMRAKGWGPTYPPGNTLIDVQGFVFWDPGHTTAEFHHYSGWELHSFTAWRLAQ